MSFAPGASGKPLPWCEPYGSGKNGLKRHLLPDGRGFPLSPIMTGANAHNIAGLAAILDTQKVAYGELPLKHNKHVCAVQGIGGSENRKTIEKHCAIPHIVDRHTRAEHLQRNPLKRARSWVGEVCHSWFNSFNKLFVQFEKLERSFVALNHLSAAIIAFLKVQLAINIIYE